MTDGATTETIQTRCCIAGGGPAGMMLGFLLARADVPVVVLEKHADFLRDFRGDTVHPSTLEVIHELGLLDEFLKIPHTEVRHASGQIGDQLFDIADFSHLPTHCKFIALMPQWDFLNFLAAHGKRYPAFHLRMQAEATGLIEENARVVGVRAKTPQGALEVRAELVVGADGRHSLVRTKAELPSEDFGAPMDVLWMRLSHEPADPEQTLGRIETGRMMVMFDRGDYWQCAFVIPKGGIEKIRARGLPAFREDIAQMAPFTRDRLDELKTWDDIKLLTVAVDRLTRWFRPGLLCIGDAAHAMSPIGGVGINLAIQDAVAAANILAPAFLRAGGVTTDDLERVQRRRDLPARVTQRVQLAVQNRVISHVLSGQKVKPPWILKLTQRWPMLRRIPAYAVGIGFRPEHVKTRESDGAARGESASLIENLRL
jgi:2-polyprenyl-6-methoxyphenol hydroxylase-like FAD-dependent oxidoreductase